MTLQLYHRQLSNKALTIDNGGQPLFIPKSFTYTTIGSHFVDVDVPEWYKEKYKEELTSANNNALLTMKRLCE